ncbi:transposase [Mesorhizobium australicum]
MFDVHVSQPTELSTTAMAGIQAIYRIEEEIRGLPPAERLAARRSRIRPLVRALWNARYRRPWRPSSVPDGRRADDNPTWPS